MFTVAGLSVAIAGLSVAFIDRSVAGLFFFLSSEKLVNESSEEALLRFGSGRNVNRDRFGRLGRIKKLVQLLIMPEDIVGNNVKNPIQISLNRVKQADVKIAVLDDIDTVFKLFFGCFDRRGQNMRSFFVKEGIIGQRNNECLILRKKGTENLIHQNSHGITDIVVELSVAVWQFNAQERLVRKPAVDRLDAFNVQSDRSCRLIITIAGHLKIAGSVNKDIGKLMNDLDAGNITR